MDQNFTQLSTDESLEKTINSLKAANIDSTIAATSEDAIKAVHNLIPEKAEVMTMTSVTLETLGLTKEINESEKYTSIRKGWESLDKENPADAKKMQQEGAAPDWAIGSAHAVTEDGHIFIASNTGSQLAAYVYGANHVIWVVSTKKIVKNEVEAKKRIFEHVLPLESARARKAYGLPDTFNSNVSKLLEINKEVRPGRLHIVFVKEDLGF